MKRSKLTAEEIFKAEKAKDDRVESRKRGFSKMEERDASYRKLRNYKGGEVVMQWHIPDERREEGIAYSGVPEGMFILKSEKETLVFDAEEFRKALRWV
jgi:hypothetical protein